SMIRLQVGGKCICKIFCLISTQFADLEQNKEQIKTVAVELELIHMETLVHDDVVDDASLRRGKPTVKKLYGDRVAMYTEDYMLARALEVITTIENPSIHRLLSRT